MATTCPRCIAWTAAAFPAGGTAARYSSTPSSADTASATSALSPVIMTERTPLRRSSATASFDSGLTRSARAKAARTLPSEARSTTVRPLRDREDRSGRSLVTFISCRAEGESMKVIDTLGEVNLGFDLAGQVSAKVVCGWNIGQPEVVDLGGFEGTAAEFRSQNYPGGDPFNVQVNETIGNILLEGRWSG